MTSVRDYGAKGDGYSDDTAAFVSCMAANETVDVPAGTYRLTGLDVLSGRTIRGASGARLLAASGLPVGARVLRVQNVTDVRLESFEFDGNGSAQPPSEQAKGIYIQDASAVRIYAVSVHDAMGDALSVYGTSESKTTAGILIDRFSMWNQGRSGLVVHGVAPSEVVVRDAHFDRGTPIPSPVRVQLVDFEPSNPGVCRAFTLERVSVKGGSINVSVSPSAAKRSVLDGLTMRDVTIEADGGVGLGIGRVFCAALDNVSVIGTGSVGVTLRDQGPGIAGELGRIVASKVRVAGAWSQDGISVWTNGLAPPGGIMLDGCDVSGVAANLNAGRCFFVGDGMRNVSLFGCTSHGGSQGFALTGVSRALLSECHAVGASLRSYRFRGGSPYQPASVYAQGCTGTLPLLEVAGDVTGDWSGITQEP